MKNINNLKKVQIILLALILIVGVIFVVTVIKLKNNKEKYATASTIVQSEDKMEVDSITKTDEMVIEVNETEKQEGDVSEENPEDTSWDDKDAKDTKVDTEEEKKQEKKTGNKYYIKINYAANVVTVYTKDSGGNYTVPVKAIVCSTGKATPTGGIYKMSNKYRWHQLNGGVYGQYCSRITGHILFHSVPYAKNTPDSLKYVAYDKLGTKASAGCIRLTCQDAMWIYNNCPSGTYVEFYSSSNPGPLGKPSAQKISSNAQCRNWDPTDPTKGNPWHTYVAPVSNAVSEKNTVQEQITKREEPVKKEPVKQETKIEVKEDTNTQKQNSTAESDNVNKSNDKENNSKENNIKSNTTNTTNSSVTSETKEEKKDNSKNTNNLEQNKNSNITKNELIKDEE